MRRKLWEFLVAEIDTAVLVRILTNSGHPFPEPRHESDKTLVFPFLLMIKYPLIQQFSLPKHFKQMFMIIFASKNDVKHPGYFCKLSVMKEPFCQYLRFTEHMKVPKQYDKINVRDIRYLSGLWSNAWFSSVFHLTFQNWIFWKAMSDWVQRHSNRAAVPLPCQGIPWVLRRTLITLHVHMVAWESSEREGKTPIQLGKKPLLL